MASVSVLYIEDALVAPHLELLRNLCDPSSRSRPHITVRYSSKVPVPAKHLSTPVTHIDLLEPGSFGVEDGSGGNRTVFIRCRCDELVPYEYKPHYPSSEFHITLYDGSSLQFARALLQTLRRHPWDYMVPLPNGATLTSVAIRRRRASAAESPKPFRELVGKLFHEITGQQLTVDLVESLSRKDRLRITEDVCSHLAVKARHLRAPRRRQRRELPEIGDGSIQTDLHLTPPELAQSIAQFSLGLLKGEEPEINFGDPAVGTGAFFSALLQVLPKDRLASAIGVEIDARQVTAARWRWAKHGMKVIRGDYLQMKDLPPRNLVLANPPYLRHQGIPKEYKESLRGRASALSGLKISARSGQYVYFLLLSHEWMAPGGVAAWLIPSEFMQTEYGRAIRHYLTHRVQLIRVHQFAHDDPQFENAKVLPSVVVFRKAPPSLDDAVVLTTGGDLQNPTTQSQRSVRDLRRAEKWLITSLDADHSGSGVTIQDLFEVRRGIATGANEFFVMERRKARDLGIPSRALRPILPKARTLENDVVERDDDGYPKVSPQLSLLDLDLPEAEVASRYPRLMSYLRGARKLGIRERNLVRQRQPWYKQERRLPPMFLCTYMGRGRAGGPPLRFIWNKSDAVATNTYLLLYPRAHLARLLEGRPRRVEQLFAVLQRAAHQTMSERWRTHAEGLRKIEPSELLQVRLSEIPHWLEGSPMPYSSLLDIECQDFDKEPAVR